ncbi:interferon-inducible double-stranded RNA-dependent protein kinase activator A homolog isoform X1 [Aphis gossypii]|uniref:interferon-inducible double-stranded RNA-dependent protein kinase activator A homolog isoform X1 n=1 Tax=Aphis gossypii TaxID=80765 RepID=UPI00100F17DD|nr:interferon-inducible double-stranded RNA-dependent protein kinase activator A homolog isoform X1 [Aphis gossypii]
MAEPNGLQLISKYSSAVSRLHNIMAKQGKSVQYNMLSVVDLLPNKIYMYYATCGKIITYGCGSSSNEATNDAANKFLNKLASIAEIDDYLPYSTNPPCLESNIKFAQSINYIGTLQELCRARVWNLPKYECCAVIEGEYNNKEHLFTVICSTGPYKSKGVGKNKKIAKTHAAYSMLNQINMNQHITNNTYTSNDSNEKMNEMENDKLGLSISLVKNDTVNKALHKNNHINSNESRMFTNYIGILQDICIAHGWELPKYEFHKENNNDLYSVICSVGPHKSMGKGHAKKIAKKQAAQLLLEQISLNQETSSMSHRNITHEIVDKGFNQLLSSEKKWVQKLKECNSLDELNMSGFEFLTKLAYEKCLSITCIQYLDDCGKIELSLKITTPTAKPVLICSDTGKTYEDAKNAAAKSVLKYIKHFLI